MADVRETEAEKRKRTEDNGFSRRQKKGREDNGNEAAVKEEEIEEFFGILRRIHVAVSYFKNGDGDGRRMTEEGSGLRAILERVGNEEEVNGVKMESKREEGVEENAAAGFDLNADPGPECDPV